ncbi:MAG: hypothetical protein Q8L88_15760 [Bacteroidota bacterium]|nr:hypothetical protein [Bacteroidota bacterium]
MKIFLAIIVSLLLSACDKASETIATQNPTVKDSVVAIPFPSKFISVNYIELDKIERISKFRSAIGHDYSDGVESCRSMKHYFQPKSAVDWSQVKIFSPIEGTVVRIFEEWAGTQVQIQPKTVQSCTIIIFHIALQKPLTVGDSVYAGELLGTHIGSQTMSDIAVGFSVQNSWKLFSYFDVMTDSLFQQYTAKGLLSRNECIISKETRDADSLKCNGDTFGSSGTLENWVVLK